MFSRAHIDEKLFYVMQRKGHLITISREVVKSLAVKSIRFSTKMMFLSAVVRNRYDAHRKVYSNGRIGLCSFVKPEKAQKSFRNLSEGIMTTAPISMDKDFY